MLVVVGCGGSAAATAPGGGGQPTAPGETASTSSAEPSSEVSADPGPGNAGGIVPAVCDLVTVAELERIFGLTAITTEVIEGPPDTCDVQSDDAPLAAWVLMTPVPPYVYDSYATDDGASTVPGIGDKAAFVPGQGLLIFQKGDVLVSVGVYADEAVEAQNVEFMKAIAKAAAGRL